MGRLVEIGIRIGEKDKADFTIHLDDRGVVVQVSCLQLDLPQNALRLMYGKDMLPHLLELHKMVQYLAVIFSCLRDRFSPYLHFYQHFGTGRSLSSDPFLSFGSTLSPEVYKSDPVKYRLAQYFSQERNSTKIIAFIDVLFGSYKLHNVPIFEDEGFLEVWRQFVQSPRKSLRNYSIWRLSQVNDFETLTIIRRQLWDKELQKVLEAIEWIAVFRDDWAIYRLHQLASVQQRSVVIAAIRAIGNLRMPESIPVLYRLRMEHEDQEIANKIAIAFQKIDDARIFNLKWKLPPAPNGKPLVSLSESPILRTPLAYLPDEQEDYFDNKTDIVLATALNRLYTYEPIHAKKILASCLNSSHHQLYTVACRLIEWRKESDLFVQLFSTIRNGSWRLNPSQTMSALKAIYSPVFAPDILQLSRYYVDKLFGPDSNLRKYLSEPMFNSLQILMYFTERRIESEEKNRADSDRIKEMTGQEHSNLEFLVELMHKLHFKYADLLLDFWTNTPKSNMPYQIEQLYFLLDAMENQVKLTDIQLMFSGFTKNYKDNIPMLKMVFVVDADTTISLLHAHYKQVQYTSAAKAQLLAAMASLRDVRTLPLFQAALQTAYSQTEKAQIKKYMDEIIP